MLDLYIYYKVADDQAAALAPRVRAMQAELASRHGVAGQLKQRPLSANGLQTWMEIYPGTPPGFELTLERAVAAAGLAGAIAGERHTEIFMDCPPCA